MAANIAVLQVQPSIRSILPPLQQLQPELYMSVPVLDQPGWEERPITFLHHCETGMILVTGIAEFYPMQPQMSSFPPINQVIISR